MFSRRQSGGGAVLKLRRFLAWSRNWMSRHPTTVFLAVLVSAFTVGGAMNSEMRLEPQAVSGPAGFDLDRWWSSLSSLFSISDPLALTLLIPLLLLVMGLCEKRMGSVRSLVVYLLGGVLSGVAGFGIGFLEEQYLELVPLNAATLDTLSPLAPLVCTAMAASSFMSALWRRRVRLLTTVVAATLYLYAGSSNDLFSLVAVPIGLGLGYAFGGKRRPVRVVRSSHHEKRVLLAALVLVTSIGPAVATFGGSGAGLLSIYGFLSSDPISVVDGQVCAFGSMAAPCPAAYSSSTDLQPAAGAIALLPIIVAILAAVGLLRGRRDALWILVILNAALFGGMIWLLAAIQPDTLALLAQARDTETQEYVWQTLVGLVVGAAVPLIVLIALLTFRRDARASSTAPARRTFAVALAGGAGVGVALCCAGTIVAREGYLPSPPIATIITEAPLRLIPPTLFPSDALTFVPYTDAAQAAWYLPSVVFWMTVVIATARLVLSPGAVAGVADRARIRALVRRGGGDNLSYMATWSGNSYWFSSTLDAAFAYRVHGAVAVTLGAAIGPDSARTEVAREFVEFCGGNGWTPVFYSVNECASVSLAELGWQRLPVAEEAILNPLTWTSAGKKRQDVRTATNRARRENLSARWTSWDRLSFAEHTQIREISEVWVAEQGLPEMEFTLGGVDQLVDPAVRLMIATDENGRIHAITSWLPTYALGGAIDGYTLDLMRRRPDAMNGVMEFTIGAAIDALRNENLSRLSLSGSPLATVVDETDAAVPLARLLASLGEMIEPGYGFRSLHSFKRKFQPEFVSLWLVYPDNAVLPAAAVAIARCYIPNLTIAKAVRMGGALRRSGISAPLPH